MPQICRTLGLLLLQGGSLLPADSDREIGLGHYLNREFDLAVERFQRYSAAAPVSAEARLLLAKALLYQELDRLGHVGTRAFRGDQEYRSAEKPKPDPEAVRQILGALEQGQQACERVLAEAADDRQSLHWLAQLHLMRASYEYFIAKDYLRALARGRKGRQLSYRVGQIYPEFADGLLVAGFYEYLLGSLPWPLRAMIAIRGDRGNKQKGIQIVERVVREGGESRDEARVLQALIYRRERAPREAAEAFGRLAEDFPRSYLFALESADLYESAGERDTALELFREVSEKRKSGMDRFDRMPECMAAALERRIRALERK